MSDINNILSFLREQVKINKTHYDIFENFLKRIQNLETQIKVKSYYDSPINLN